MTNEPSSPVCYAHEGSDIYMGFATRDELVAALNELLEAERAGARATLRRHRPADDREMAAFLVKVHGDEARWCGMLSAAIRMLGGKPSRRCGAFYGKVIAIADPAERLAFLNRGQAWVVRKLDALTPRVRDEALHASLREMADSHRENIGRTDAFLSSASVSRQDSR